MTGHIGSAILILMIVGTCLNCLFAFIILQVLYYGWKEQEKLASDSGSYEAK